VTNLSTLTYGYTSLSTLSNSCMWTYLDASLFHHTNMVIVLEIWNNTTAACLLHCSIFIYLIKRCFIISCWISSLQYFSFGADQQRWIKCIYVQAVGGDLWWCSHVSFTLSGDDWSSRYLLICSVKYQWVMDPFIWFIREVITTNTLGLMICCREVLIVLSITFLYINYMRVDNLLTFSS
jgi:hypothetical protein